MVIAFYKPCERYRHDDRRGAPVRALPDPPSRATGQRALRRRRARELQDGHTAEVTRVCADGARNACSMLLSACRRGAHALGYRRLVTYTLSSEPGASLGAASWREVAAVRGWSWSCASRPRDSMAIRDKRRWEAALPALARAQAVPNANQEPRHVAA
ncbi:XF1762 family protein [Nannocystis pusilla]|uniref:Uncharacterized protein n=1 Tax=Nannocystis pusilla TaxID=889268 RepID=A0ABS7TMB3_9BACT|nr:XF1762 family protein [Nannocystis pusilla]MBZ5709363.1 hypothetical protein [Nannocystis pusilla]